MGYHHGKTIIPLFIKQEKTHISLNDFSTGSVKTGMNIWTTVGASLVIMVISTLLVLGDKIIGQDAKTPPPRDIPPLQAPEAEK